MQRSTFFQNKGGGAKCHKNVGRPMHGYQARIQDSEGGVRTGI